MKGEGKDLLFCHVGLLRRKLPFCAKWTLAGDNLEGSSVLGEVEQLD